MRPRVLLVSSNGIARDVGGPALVTRSLVSLIETAGCCLTGVVDLSHIPTRSGFAGRADALIGLARRLWCLVRLRPPSQAPFAARAVRKRVRLAISRDKPDLLVVDNMNVLASIPRSRIGDVILAPYDCFSYHAERTMAVIGWSAAWTLRRMIYRRLERRVYPKLRRVLLFEQDGKMMSRHCTTAWTAFILEPSALPHAPPPRSPKRLVICGNFEIDAVRIDTNRFLTHPGRKRDLVFTVWGKGALQIKDLGAERVEFIPNLDQLDQLGDVAVFPQFSGVGVQTKILDCLKAGMMVIADGYHLTALKVQNSSVCHVAANHTEMWELAEQIIRTDARVSAGALDTTRKEWEEIWCRLVSDIADMSART